MIEHYLTIANQFLVAHPYYGLLFAFLVAFIESLPILGTLFPGSITMTFIGILVGRNVMPLAMTLFLGTLGAILGDIIGFWIGKHYKERLHTMWPFRKHPKLLKLLLMGENFFQKHGGKSIIIGRFIGPTRSSVPLIAGLLKMRWPNFIVAALPSAFLWALLYLLPGILIGAISLALPKEKATTFTFIGLGLIVFLWLLFWAIQRFFFYLAGIVNRLIDRCWNWTNRHHSSKFIIRIISVKSNPLDHYQLTLVFLAIIAALLFGYIFLCVKYHFGLFYLNDPTFYFLQSLRNHQADMFFVTMTALGDKYTLLTVSLIIVSILAIQRRWHTLRHLLILMLFAFGSVWVMKHIAYFPRPTGFMKVSDSSSFPSGHTVLSLSLIGFFSFLAANCLARPWRWIPYTLTAIIVLLVALSRIYLGAHWLCDVLAGICLGFTILLTIIISYRRGYSALKRPRMLLYCIIFAIIIPWILITIKTYRHLSYQYTPFFAHQTIAINSWWRFPDLYLPTYRLNRFGRPIQPFNVQWAGDIKTIRQQLLKQGWLEIKTKENLQFALQRFASKAPEQHLSFLPQLYRRQAPKLFMLKHIPKNKSIIELRLWNTGITFNDSPARLWIGSINYHNPAPSLINLKPSLQITLEDSGGINNLINDIKKKYLWKTIKITRGLELKKIQQLQWDGSILLIMPTDYPP